MSRVLKSTAMLAALSSAQMLSAAAHAEEPALRTSAFVSDDADGTTVAKVSAGMLFGYRSPSSYRGVVAEAVRIRPLGGDSWDDRRIYLAFADDGYFDVKGLVGTDGRTVVGSVSAVREEGVRQEYFIERDRLETPRGVRGEGLYHTFAGAAFDVPLDSAGTRQLTLLGGVQDFTGRNLRAHLRARYIAVVAPDSGISLQLRARAFRNTHPFEADYYSPAWFVEAMPAVQIRRFRKGWMWAAAAGWGRQKGGDEWQQARLVEFSVNSPLTAAGGQLRLNALYSNTPVGARGSYGYRQLSVEWVRPL
ncbi:MAG: hypothetical protein ACOY37_07125 [Pseudomonadota bacterium]